MKYYIGVDIGGMSTKVGLVDENGNIMHKDTCVTQVDKPFQVIVKDTYDLICKVADDYSLSLSDISGIGIGCPGTVDSAKGIITYAGNLNFVKVNFLKELSKYTKIPSYIGNDANCAALGETYFGSGKEYSDTILITLGTGVGSGIIINNKIFEGKNGEGAEAGHLVLKINGEKCGCGEKGCWEAYASATALIKQTQKALQKYPDTVMHEIVKDMGKVSGRTAFIGYRQGDKVATKVVKQYVTYVAMGIVTMVNIFRPDVVMLGGGVSNEGDYFISMVEKVVRKHAFGGKHNTPPKVVRASLGNNAGIVGAAALAIK